MTHVIPAACAAQLGGLQSVDSPVLVLPHMRDDDIFSTHLMEHVEGADPIVFERTDRLLLPQSFAALTRILARFVGLVPDCDNVPRWAWHQGKGAWRLGVSDVDMRHTHRLWASNGRRGRRWTPVRDGSPVLGRDRAVVAVERRRAFAGVFVWEARLARAVGAVAAKHGQPSESDVRTWTEDDVAELEKAFWLEQWSVAVIGV